MNVFKIIFIFLFVFSFLNVCKDREASKGPHYSYHTPMDGQEFSFCDVHTGSCPVEIVDSENKILLKGTLNLQPKPIKHMQEVEFILDLEQPNMQNIEIIIDLTMPDMYMGENKVYLKQIKKNQYYGKGVFPECTMNHTRWNMGIIIKTSENKTYHKNIQFDIQT